MTLRDPELFASYFRGSLPDMYLEPTDRKNRHSQESSVTHIGVVGKRAPQHQLKVNRGKLAARPDGSLSFVTSAQASQLILCSMSEVFHGTDAYIVSDSLARAVNVAVAIGRPLLVKGEPGTGKTLLAVNLAQALRMELIRWQIKSTTKAVDGLYHYDTVRRLHDSRFGEGNVHNIADYIELGPLGRAFESESKKVVLIDEIDKADLEFPNDLLHELDAMNFSINETHRTVEAKHRPVVVITSNNEKELPDAFLRRCVFHWIDFPDRDLMTRIVAVHHPNVAKTLLKPALDIFYRVRDLDGLRKAPSTSELIDWLSALRHSGIDAKDLDAAKIPFLGVLLKKEQDWSTVQRQFSGPRSFRRQ